MLVQLPSPLAYPTQPSAVLLGPRSLLSGGSTSDLPPLRPRARDFNDAPNHPASLKGDGLGDAVAAPLTAVNGDFNGSELISMVDEWLHLVTGSSMEVK